MNNKIFYFLVAGFTLGIFLSSFVKLGFNLAYFLLILSILIFLFANFLAGNEKKIILLAIFIFFFASGIIRYEIKEVHQVDESISRFVDQKVILKGVITAEPNMKEGGTELTVKSLSFQNQKTLEEIKIEEKI